MTNNELTQYRVECTKYLHGEGFSLTPLGGKRPLNKGWQAARRETLEEALAWAERGNVGIRTGQISGGLIVIDVDKGVNPDDLEGLQLPQTVTVETGGGGRHYYFRTTATIGNSAGKLGKHIDVRGDSGQVVAPGSIHPDTGEPYYFAENLAPWEIETAELPEHIVKLLEKPKPARTANQSADTPKRSAKYGQTALEYELDILRKTPEGKRNEQFNKSAFNIGQLIATGELDYETSRSELLTTARAIGLEEKEIQGTLKSGLEDGMSNPRPERNTRDLRRAKRTYPCTDLGNSERLIDTYGDTIAYVPQWGPLVWTGKNGNLTIIAKYTA